MSKEHTETTTEQTKARPRAKSDFRLDDEQRKIVSALAALQTEMRRPDGEKLSDEDFARRYIGHGGAAWGLMKAALKPDTDGGYFAMIQRPQKLLAALKNKLTMLRRQRAGATTGRHEFHRFDDFVAAFRAVEEAKEREDANRLIFFLAPSGGGKTELAKQLAAEGASVVEARKAWRKSYFTALCDIADALHVSRESLWTPAGLEDAIAGRAAQYERALLVIDEGRFFGPDTLDLLIWLLNKTTLTILICAPPEYYDRWATKHRSEAAQVVRRTHMVIKANVITADDAEKILKECALNGSLRDAAKLARDAANDFGRYDFLHRLADKLAEQPFHGLDDVRNAIAKVHADMNAQVLLALRKGGE